jgi:hypothetical protein
LLFQSPRLQLADEETGGEEAHTLGKDVLGEDVDERWQEDEGHGGLVDEEEGDELGHGRLEDGHLLWANLGLLVLAREESGTRHGGNGWASSHGRAGSGGPGEGAEEACGVHVGLLDEGSEAWGDERRWCCGRGGFGGVAIVVRKSSHSCDPGTCRVRAEGLALLPLVPPALHIFPTTTFHQL